MVISPETSPESMLNMQVRTHGTGSNHSLESNLVTHDARVPHHSGRFSKIGKDKEIAYDQCFLQNLMVKVVPALHHLWRLLGHL